MQIISKPDFRFFLTINEKMEMISKLLENPSGVVPKGPGPGLGPFSARPG